MLIASSWLDQSNCAEKKSYRRSFFLVVVYYRQSCGRYLTKNCADNATGEIGDMFRERLLLLGAGGQMDIFFSVSAAP